MHGCVFFGVFNIDQLMVTIDDHAVIRILCISFDIDRLTLITLLRLSIGCVRFLNTGTNVYACMCKINDSSCVARARTCLFDRHGWLCMCCTCTHVRAPGDRERDLDRERDRERERKMDFYKDLQKKEKIQKRKLLKQC
jgi:hypothetical protein